MRPDQRATMGTTKAKRVGLKKRSTIIIIMVSLLVCLYIASMCKTMRT